MLPQFWQLVRFPRISWLLPWLLVPALASDPLFGFWFLLRLLVLDLASPSLSPASDT